MEGHLSIDREGGFFLKDSQESSRWQSNVHVKKNCTSVWAVCGIHRSENEWIYSISSISHYWICPRLCLIVCRFWLFLFCLTPIICFSNITQQLPSPSLFFRGCVLFSFNEGGIQRIIFLLFFTLSSSIVKV